MGKIDDMRRLREEQFAEAEKRRAKAPVAPVAPVATPEPAPVKTPKTKAAADPDAGKCPDCGKVKPLKNGVLASHQKGFGKACPGSRKAPA